MCFFLPLHVCSRRLRADGRPPPPVRIDLPPHEPFPSSETGRHRTVRSSSETATRPGIRMPRPPLLALRKCGRSFRSRMVIAAGNLRRMTDDRMRQSVTRFRLSRNFLATYAFGCPPERSKSRWFGSFWEKRRAVTRSVGKERNAPRPPSRATSRPGKAIHAKPSPARVPALRPVAARSRASRPASRAVRLGEKQSTIGGADRDRKRRGFQRDCKFLHTFCAAA